MELRIRIHRSPVPGTDETGLSVTETVYQQELRDDIALDAIDVEVRAGVNLGYAGQLEVDYLGPDYVKGTGQKSLEDTSSLEGGANADPS